MRTLASFERLDSTQIVEEETLSDYNPQHYYPVKLGAVLHDRYRVIGKLGYGSASTVWLCRDLQNEHQYVALKIYINNLRRPCEKHIHEKINGLQKARKVREQIRELFTSFEIQGPYGTHICLVLEALGMCLAEVKESRPGEVFSTKLLRLMMRPILMGLQFLHKEVQVIHTDLQPSNMLLGIRDKSVLAQFEQDEIEIPFPRKELDNRTIYVTRSTPLTNEYPSIIGLSQARSGDTKHTDWIMPNLYRAPEVILGVPWSYPVDVWGFGMVLWDLFQPRHIFSPHDSEGRYSEAHHLAQMIAVMGPPPLSFLQQCGDIADRYWDKNGTWKELAPIPETSLEQLDQRLEGREKQLFIAFMRKMLQWDPADRQDSEAVYWDEWLLADLVESGEFSPAINTILGIPCHSR